MNRPSVANVIIGGALLVLGVVTLIANLFQLDLNLRFWWPLFVLVPGIVIGLTYLSSRQKRVNLLVPTIILTIYGLTFLLNNIGSVYLNTSMLWATTVFVYPGAVAVAMWALWNKAGRQVTHLVPAIVLSVISFLVLCFTLFTTVIAEVLGGQRNAGLILPLLLICIGLAVIGLPALVGSLIKNTWENRFGGNPTKLQNAAESAENKTDKVVEAEIVQDKE